MAKRQLRHCCDDPECVLCQADDADAAFWDEFFARLDSIEASDLEDDISGDSITPVDLADDDEEDFVFSYTPEIVNSD